jgi:aldehyde:ferredoxin oxidoreductase
MLWHVTDGTMSQLDTENLRKIAKRAWGSEKAVDFTTSEGKAKAAFIIQNRQHAKESMVACDRFYPLLDTDKTEDGVGDPSLVPQLFEAVTGEKMSETDYYKTGELSVNLQRAIMGREGTIGRDHDNINEFNFTEGKEIEEGMIGLFNPDLEFPGTGDEIISRSGKVLERTDFEKMKDEYYTFRGWDIKSGLQNKDMLNDLKLSFVTDELEKKGFLK